eukprot:MONOS_9471.1-p1 / transcript=MONOS_9471.1 / gene=MONOS_9471 / organism=Monocercomonoides_exilis_PA203 / gene_product=unspecified product / transcript_product=unspecified product / location=Mono_scaffold00392:49681-50822(+) / protein_length=343 / sequence_SO=supercontig / SO=protein_coding / is_pseudo=false
MEMCNEDKSNDDTQELSLRDKFSKLFNELEHCEKEEQKQKIEETNRLMEEMDKEEFKSVFTEVLFNKTHKMLKKRRMSIENTCILLKFIGYWKEMKCVWSLHFGETSLSKSLKKTIIDEEKRREGKNEKLLVELCECYLFLINTISAELMPICIPCLIKVALKKEESEEAQNEVETALMVMSSAGYWEFMEQELYLNEIKEIIQYHQEYHNLKRLAYQSAWQFLINRLFNDNNLEGMIVNELCFVREAARELDELLCCVDWKREIEREEVIALMRWFQTLALYFEFCHLWNEGYAELISIIVKAFRASRDDHREISKQCIHLLRKAAEIEVIKINDLLKGGAV